VLAAFVAILFAPRADAADYGCWDAGQQAPGHYNGTTADDAGCITETDYAALYSLTALEEAGVFTVNGDGTVTFPSGAIGTIESDPFARPVAATPALEPDAPTVREVLFPFEANFSLLPS
jgi:hypothetical protein